MTNKKIDINQIYEWLDEGLNVFPIVPNQKEPLTQALPKKSQNSVIDNPFDENDIERIWTKYPNANVAVHTGQPSQIVIFDVDVSKTEGDGHRDKKDAKAFVKQLFNLFGETRVHLTPSGGYHLFYKYSPIMEGIGRRVNAYKNVFPDYTKAELHGLDGTFDLSFIDVFAGDGYALLPPSVVDGNEYKVLENFSFRLLPDFPYELIEPLTRKNKVVETFYTIKEGLEQKIKETDLIELKKTGAFLKGGEARLNKALLPFMGAGAGERHMRMLSACGIIYASLPYKDWHLTRNYLDKVISTFNPRYKNSDKPAENDADEREIVNVMNYCRTKEYLSRVNEEVILKKEREDRAKTEVEKLNVEKTKTKESKISEEDYIEQVAELEKLFQRDKNDSVIVNEYNVGLLLTHHPKFKGRIRYDHFTEELTYKTTIGSKFAYHFLEDSKTNPALSKIHQDIQVDFFPKVSRATVYSSALLVGHNADFDSYKAEMETYRYKWDGVERLHLWLSKVFNLPADIYHQGVSSQFIFAMVRRAYDPGADFPRVLYLSGEQGIGKSFAMNILGGQNGYLEFNSEIGDREFFLHAKGKKLIDLAEGETMRRSSIERVKSLISDNKGTHRTFASAEVKEHPPRYVISITNNNAPLLDSTGNRRYMIIKPDLGFQQLGDIRWLNNNRFNLFAEAVHKYYLYKEKTEELEEKAKALEEEDRARNYEQINDLYRQIDTLKTQEKKLDDKELDIYKDVGFRGEELTPAFKTEYGIAIIPQNMMNVEQEGLRLKSILEVEMLAILRSYDSFRAGSPDFAITPLAIYTQINDEIIRQSRLGSFALNEINRLIEKVAPELRGVKRRVKIAGLKDGREDVYMFEKPIPNNKERLETIKTIRERIKAIGQRKIPYFREDGSKAVTLDQKSAIIRYLREENSSYYVLTDEDIANAMEDSGTIDNLVEKQRGLLFTESNSYNNDEAF